MLMTSSRVIN